MTQTKKIEPGRWIEFLSAFSNGNRGRLVAIETADMANGDQPLTNGAPLFAIDYDPAGKGNDLVITTGSDAIDYSHTISAPVQIGELQDDNGKVVSLEVIDQNGGKTIIVFKS